MRMFLPKPRQTNVAILFAFGALFAAFYIRNFVIASREIEMACDTGVPETICFLRFATLDFQQTQFFGVIAFAAAAYHLWKPDFRFFLLALTMAVFGLVLYNNTLSAFAIGLTIISFARPVPLSRPTPERAAALRTTRPASSKPPH